MSNININWKFKIWTLCVPIVRALDPYGKGLGTPSENGFGLLEDSNLYLSVLGLGLGLGYRLKNHDLHSQIPIEDSEGESENGEKGESATS